MASLLEGAQPCDVPRTHIRQHLYTPRSMYTVSGLVQFEVITAGDVACFPTHPTLYQHRQYNNQIDSTTVHYTWLANDKLPTHTSKKGFPKRGHTHKTVGSHRPTRDRLTTTLNISRSLMTESRSPSMFSKSSAMFPAPLAFSRIARR